MPVVFIFFVSTIHLIDHVTDNFPEDDLSWSALGALAMILAALLGTTMSFLLIVAKIHDGRLTNSLKKYEAQETEGPHYELLSGFDKNKLAVDRERGRVLFFAGCCLVAVSIGIPAVSSFAGTNLPGPASATIGGILSTIGFATLLRSRHYFLISAKALLSIDKRNPIIFLRSFNDDDHHQFKKL
jgi:hypothetical protein